MSKGFTLIEMVVVILLLGILSSVAIPRFARRIELAEIRAEKDFTNQIFEELELYSEEQMESIGMEFFFRIQEGYYKIAHRNPHRCVIVDGAQPENKVFKSVIKEMSNKLLIKEMSCS